MVNPQLPQRTHPSQKSPINPGFRSLDWNSSNRFRVYVGRARTANDCVGEALVPHVVQTGQQQRGADTTSSGARINAGRTEEIGTCRVMAGKAQQALSLDRDEAGDGFTGKRNVGFTGPCFAE